MTMNFSHSLTVIVPVYGPGPHLDRVISALRRQSPPVAGIIISHSGSCDPTERLANLAGLTVLHSPRRLYASAARNRAMALATTEWIAFVDEDVIVDDGWHATLLRSISRGGVDCIAGSIGYAETGGYWGMSLWFAEFGSVHPYLAAKPISSGPSANLTVRRELFASAGGYPEHWQTGEELLPQAKLEAAGYRIRFEPEAVGRHVNLPGLRRMLRHNRIRGAGSAMVRRACPHLTGSLAVQKPLLSLGLWVARMGQIYWRVLTARRGPIGALLLHTPGILMAVLAWNTGFTEEAFADRPSGRPNND